MRRRRLSKRRNRKIFTRTAMKVKRRNLRKKGSLGGYMLWFINYIPLKMF